MRFDQSKRIFAPRQTELFIATLVLMLLVNHLTLITTNAQRAQTDSNQQRELFERNARFQKILEQVNGDEKTALALFQRDELENDYSPKILLQSDSKNSAQNVIADGGALDATLAPKINAVGSVSKTVVLPNDKAIISGGFVRINNVERNRLARLNADGSVDTTFNFTATQINGNPIGSIENFAVQPDGKIIAFGSPFSFPTFVVIFGTSVRPAPDSSVIAADVRQVFRINSDGSLDNTFVVTTFDNFANITSITPGSDGKTVLSGGFSSFNGVMRNGIVRLNADGSVDTTFNPNSGANNTIVATAVQTDGKVLIGGSFTSYNGTNINALARLNVDGTLDDTFNAGGAGLSNGSTTSNPVNISQIALTGDGRIYLKGSFALYNGATRTNGIARLNANGALDASFGNQSSNSTISFLNASVFSTTIIPLPNGKVLFSGTFVSFDGSRRSIAKLNSDGSYDSAFRADFGNNSFAARSNGQILVGSVAFVRNGVTHGGLVQLDENGVLNNAFSILLYNNFAPSIEKVAVQADGKILINSRSGLIINDVFKGGFSRLNADGTSDNSFNLSFANGDNSLTTSTFALQPDGKILVNTAASTTSVNLVISIIARLNSNGSLDTSFNQPNSSSQQIVVQADGKILASDLFSQINRYNSNGTIDNGFTPIDLRASSTTPSRLVAINFSVQSTGKIIVAAYNSLNNENIPRLVRYNANGSVDSSFGTVAFNASANTPSASIYDFAIQPNDKITVVGKFAGVNVANGTPQTRQSNNIERLNADGSIDTSFISSSPSTVYLNKILIQPDAKIVVAQNGSKVVRFNSDGSNDSTFYAGRGVDGSINDFALQPDAKLLVAGVFSTFNGQTRYGLARLSAVFQAPHDALFDFDGDGLADISVFRDGNWFIQQSRDGFKAVQFGVSTDKLVPADYDGDGRADIAVFRDGNWYILQSSNNVFRAVQFGLSTDKLVPADYDGDAKADIAVFRDGNWYISQSSNGVFRAVQFGLSNDKLVPADYDGDGRADIAVARANGNSLTWYIQQSTFGFTATNFGFGTDKAVAADYDGDGRADIAVFRNNTWYVQGSSSGFVGLQFGQAGDVPVVGDYDGDGRADFAVTRQVNNSLVWYVQQSSVGFRSLQFGTNTDKSLPSSYNQ